MLELLEPSEVKEVFVQLKVTLSMQLFPRRAVQSYKRCPVVNLIFILLQKIEGNRIQPSLKSTTKIRQRHLSDTIFIKFFL